MSREVARHACPHAWNSEPEEEAPELRGSTFLNGSNEIRRRRRGESGELLEFRFRQIEEDHELPYEPLLDERRGRLQTEARDVEAVSGTEVHQPPPKLGRAPEPVGADGSRADHEDGRPAVRADLGHPKGRIPLPLLPVEDLDDLRDHIARPLHPHAVPLADVLSG